MPRCQQIFIGFYLKHTTTNTYKIAFPICLSCLLTRKSVKKSSTKCRLLQCACAALIELKALNRKCVPYAK